jgi:hypothetical protein
MSAFPTAFLPDDVDALLQLLANTEREWADLASLHGSFGKWNDIRKAKLATVALKLREGDPPAKAKAWTDSLLDTASHADEDYKRFVFQGQRDAARFHLLDQQRDAVLIKVKSLTYIPR